MFSSSWGYAAEKTRGILTRASRSVATFNGRTHANPNYPVEFAAR